jgi:hypothetical protein
MHTHSLVVLILLFVDECLYENNMTIQKDLAIESALKVMIWQGQHF